MERLEDVARRSDHAVREARADLVRAVRHAAAEGQTQQQIAAAIGRSQPEVSRLLRFHGTTPLARRLRSTRSEVIRLVRAMGGSDVRVFGSLARGQDTPESDVDLLFHMGRPLSLFELEALAQRVGALVGSEVDLLPDTAIRPDLRERVRAEAVPL